MAAKTHGMSRTRIYHIWNSMRQRCEKPNAISYKYYGAKGISVCFEWQDFNNFYSWALENGYKHNLTIERKDPNGDYEPSNCKWATRKEQQNNTSYCRLITYGGKTLTVTQWAELLNISRNVLYNRLRRGWDIERLLTTNKNKWRKNYG